jgi:hypothetical protein
MSIHTPMLMSPPATQLIRVKRQHATHLDNPKSTNTARSKYWSVGTKFRSLEPDGRIPTRASSPANLYEEAFRKV